MEPKETHTEGKSGQDEDPIAKLKIPSYLMGRIPIIGRYYGDEFQKTLAVAKALSVAGFDTYPDSRAKITTVTSEAGEVFNFLGGDKMIEPPFMVQLGFFRLMKESDKDVRKNFCYAAIQHGYLGRTASIEIAYAMATRKKVLFSEMPTRFSAEVPENIVSIIRENCERYPMLPIDEVETGLTQAREQNIEYPLVSDEQKRDIYTAILGLERDLRREFGFKVE